MHAQFISIYYTEDSWEFVTSLDFEWSFLTRKKSFGWPMVIAYVQIFFLCGIETMSIPRSSTSLDVTVDFY